jgi:hypothetical protein
MSLMKKLGALSVVAFIHLCGAPSPSWADNGGSPKVTLRQPMTKTPMTRVELLVALREAHVRVFGKVPNKNRLAMAWGQVAFENGHGQLSYNHNLGNVASARPAETPSYYSHDDHHFYRAFATFVDGAEAYWAVIKRCGAALARFDQGNPSEAARYLKRCGYFEADLEQYTKGFSNLYYFARTKVFAEEERERQQRQDIEDAANDQLVKLIEAAEAARQATRDADLNPDNY